MVENLYNEQNKEDLAPSKSALKRRMADLQKLADSLTKISEAELLGFDLPESLVDSIKTAGRLKASNARNRELRHSGKLLDKCGDEVVEHLRGHFEAQRSEAQSFNRKHKSIENWRDRLIENPNEGISALLESFPNTDRQELRALVRLAVKEKNMEKPPTQQRKLFCYLRDQVIA